MTEAAAVAAGQSASSGARTNLVRVGLFLAGLALLGWLLQLVRAERVVSTVVQSASWLPLLGLLEIATVATDVLAVGALLAGDRSKVSTLTWFKSSALAYVSSVLLPAGRAAAEAARAAVLSPAVGGARAIVIAARLQACALIGNATTSLLLIPAILVAAEPNRLLGWALAGNAAVCAAIVVFLLFAIRRAHARNWFGVGLANAPMGNSNDLTMRAPLRRQMMHASLFYVLGRAIQVVECGVLLRAVGGAVSATRTAAAEGIRLVGGAVGDLIPGQLGASEGAYLTFSGAIGLAGEPARAVSLPLVLQVVQLSIAAVAAVGAALVGYHRPRGDA